MSAPQAERKKLDQGRASFYRSQTKPFTNHRTKRAKTSRRAYPLDNHFNPYRIFNGIFFSRSRSSLLGIVLRREAGIWSPVAL
jgi:hypothetical protein